VCSSDLLAKVYPNADEIEFYDDDERHIQNVRDNLIDTDYDFRVNKVTDGRL